MKKPSIVRKKSKINGQILVDIKQLPKRDPKLSFSESINNLQLKLFSKEINPSPVKNNTKQNILNMNKETKNNNSYNNGLYQAIPEENDALLKRISRHNSLKQKKKKSLAETILLKRKNKGELDTIKEIVIEDQNEKTITNNPKKRFTYKDDNEEEKRKKKINIIEELRKFDREQQIKMEEYIDNKRKKQNELMNKNFNIYNHNNYENNKNSGNINFIQRNDNKTITEEKTYESQEDQSLNANNNNEKEQNIDKNDNDKSSNNINNNNNMNDKNCKTNIKEDFQKVKEKYFSKNLFTSKFPETEYKTKYLDNFLKNDSLVKNLFANYIDETKENKNINNKNPETNNNLNTNNNKTNNNKINNNLKNKNLYNNIFEDKHTEKKNNIKRNNSTDLKLKNSNNILSIDNTNNIIDPNNKSNNFGHSLNLNTFTIYRNMIYKKYNSDGHINNSYQMILNSIDDKLNNLNKYRNKSVFPDTKFNKVSSTGKIRTISNLSFKSSKNSFRDSSFNLKNINTIKNNNKYYRDIFDKFDKYNGFKMIDHSTISPYKNNYNFNNNYKFVRAINELNDSKKYIY